MSLLAAALVSCIPALPFYCRNIHIGCAGRSTKVTHAFTAKETMVTFADGTLWHVAPQADRGATILWHKNHRDWIRIEADGRFSLRRYDKATPLMTRGICSARK